jgi:hypothetical protein
MNEENIITIKKRAGTIQGIIKLVFIIGIIICFITLIGAVFSFFASPDKFSAVKGYENWSFNYKLTDSCSFYIGVPYKIMQPLDNYLFSAKYAAITCLFTFIIRISVILYGIKQVENILKSMANNKSPFIINNVVRLKKLALIIIIYSATIDLISSLLFSGFVTRIFNFNLSNIHLSGVLIGGLIFLIADIFNYGVFLQNKFETRL